MPLRRYDFIPVPTITGAHRVSVFRLSNTNKMIMMMMTIKKQKYNIENNIIKGTEREIDQVVENH